jgi:hypothetical protein
VLLVIAGAICPIAFAQSETGTVIVFGYSKEKVIVAADSRQVNQDGGYRDDYCKVIALDSKVVFSSIGRTTSVAKDGTLEWDAAREARTAFANARHLQTDKAGDFLDRLALDWGWLIGAEMRKTLAPADVSDLADGQFVVSGIVAGLDESGALHISLEGIRINKSVGEAPRLFIDKPRPVILADAIQFKVLGEGDIFDEFTSSKTKRAKQWLAAGCANPTTGARCRP